MLAYQRQIIQLQRQTATLGSTVNVLAQLDSIVSEFVILVEGTIGTAAATANPEGLAAILQQVRITGTLSDGTPVSPINNIRGPQLNEIAQFIKTNVSWSWGALTSTGAFGAYVPCTFENWRMNETVVVNGTGVTTRFMSCLPAGTMGALSLSITLANQNQLDTNAAPTLAFTTISIGVQQNQFFKASIPAQFTYFPNSIDQQVQANPQAGTGQQQLFPNGTGYLLFLIRSMTTTTTATRTCTAKQADGTNGPVDATFTSLGLSLQDSNNVPKYQEGWENIRKENLDHITDSIVAGNACLQFNRGLQSVWRPSPGSNTIPLSVPYQLTGTTNPLVEYIFMRLWDPNNLLGLI
jgi:hypothetical protein